MKRRQNAATFGIMQSKSNQFRYVYFTFNIDNIAYIEVKVFKVPVQICSLVISCFSTFKC